MGVRFGTEIPRGGGLQNWGRDADHLGMARATSGLPGAGYEGRFGNAVFYRSGDEILMRPRVVPVNPRTPAQTQSRLAFGRASQGWSQLTDAEFAAWEAAGGYRLYMSLTRKWLAVHPHGTPPTMPSTGAFLGDAVRLTLNPTPAPPQGEGGSLTLAADRSNSAGVVTEILLQPVANTRRKPKSKGWRTEGFFAFSDTVRSVSIVVPPGVYAVAYRFVDATTGQETAMAMLGAIAID